MKHILRCFLCLIIILFSAVSGEAAQSLPLKSNDVKIIKNILTLHQKGQYDKAKKELSRVKNHTIDGYILYHKYMSPKYRTTKQEIESWLKKYNSLAIAPEIYALGIRKKMKLSAKKPKDSLYGGKSKACSYIRRDEPIDLIRKRNFADVSPKNRQQARQSYQKLRKYIEDGRTLAARQLIDSKSFQSLHKAPDIALARTALAFSYFLDGEYELSLTQAEKAIRADADSTPLAYWTAGLASWQAEEYKDAADYFAKTTSHSQIYPLLRGSGAFWAARAYLKTGDYQKVGDYLEIAAQQPRTFYGMLAMRMLGFNSDNNWNAVSTQSCQADTVSNPALTRFLALKQIGQNDWATRELTKLYLETDEDERPTLLLIARQNGFGNALKQLSGTTNGSSNERFPAPDWTPRNGWKVDKALVYAYVRQESCFNPTAKSGVGARGLMQIMPATGKAMARLTGMRWSATLIDNVSYNLGLGQSYLEYLMKLSAIDNNLIYLAVSYNGGPGNLIKWKKQINYTDDPLLFIESIPSRETRIFVERIMVNYWTYRELMGKSLSSMDDVIAGKWPMYQMN